MATVTPLQAYEALRQAGVPFKDAVMLTAIAGVESGYNTLAWNQNAGTGDDSVGLWQINYLGSLYQPRVKLTGLTPDQLHRADVQVQAQAAAKLYKQSGLQPWMPDITSGKVQAFLPGAEKAAKQAGAGVATSGLGTVYVNPLSRISGLQPDRIDQGADFGSPGGGPILALGSGRVALSSTTAGWPGGGWVSYTLDQGPAKGKTVYVAEEITPTVKTGQHVQAGEQIATLHPGALSLETGWAAGGTSDVSLSSTPAGGGISGGNLPPGGTRLGWNFDQLLVALGVKQSPTSGTQGGNLPAGFPNWSTANLGGPSSGGSAGGGPVPGGGGGGTGAGGWLDHVLNLNPALIFGPAGLAAADAGNAVGGGLAQDTGSLGKIADSIGGLTTGLSTAVGWIDWFLNPVNEIRIVAGIGGTILTIGGIWTLTHVGGDLPVIGTQTPGAALPVGIFMVGFGAILLFVAFHNLPGDVTNLPGLLGYFDLAVHGQRPAGQAVPTPPQIAAGANTGLEATGNLPAALGSTP